MKHYDFLKKGTKVKIKKSKSEYYKNYCGIEDIEKYTFEVNKDIGFGPINKGYSYVLTCSGINHNTGRENYLTEHAIYASSCDIEELNQVSMF